MLHFLLPLQLAMQNGLARTPPMGWSSWNAYAGHQSSAILRETADLLVEHGLDKLGYVNVDMDGGWYNFQKALNATGYPDDPWANDGHGGIPGLADYLHAKNLKLGMYVTGGFTDVYLHELAWSTVMFREWNADSIKVDHMCNVNNSDGSGCREAPGVINKPSDQIVPAFQRATMERWASAIASLNKTNEILFNNCGVGCSPSEGLGGRDPRPFDEWCYETANTWRSSGDINVASWHVNLASLIGRGYMGRPGAWEYPDSLEVGVTQRHSKMEIAEARAHFSLWCITSSPLYLGMKLPNITADELALVSNRDAIMINQVWAGYAGDMLNHSDPSVVPINRTHTNYSRLPQNSVWWKPLPRNQVAVVLYASRGNASMSFRFDELQWDGVMALGGSTRNCGVKDVWAGGKEVGPVSDGFKTNVTGGDVVMLIIGNCSS